MARDLPNQILWALCLLPQGCGRAISRGRAKIEQKEQQSQTGLAFSMSLLSSLPCDPALSPVPGTQWSSLRSSPGVGAAHV